MIYKKNPNSIKEQWRQSGLKIHYSTYLNYINKLGYVPLEKIRKRENTIKAQYEKAKVNITYVRYWHYRTVLKLNDEEIRNREVCRGGVREGAGRKKGSRNYY